MQLNVQPGDRIKLTGQMENDPDSVPVGTEGMVTHVNVLPGLSFRDPEWAQINVEWDNGRTLLLLDTDSFAVVE